MRTQDGLPDRVGSIVEVEAYGGPEDRASHARAGWTRRTATMYGPPGFAYVYLVYGLHHCLNVVVDAPGRPSAVLIRAVEPVGGIGAMRASAEAARRPRIPMGASGRARGTARLTDDRLASGPGRLGAAFGIDRSFDGLDLCSLDSPLRLVPRDEPFTGDVTATPRIGVAYAGDPWAAVPWRLVVSHRTTLGAARRSRTSQGAF